MRVQKIRISNVAGVEELEFEPGAFTEIRGKNGRGKSSVIRGLQAALGGGTDAQLVRKGAEVGEVVLVLDDGTEVRKRMAGGRHTVTVKHPTFGAIGSAQSFLGKITDALGLNPVELINANPKDRAQYLMEALPLKVETKEVAEAIEGTEVRVPVRAAERHALEVLSEVRKDVYLARRDVGTRGRDRATAVKQLEETIAGAPDAPDELIEEQTKLRAKIEAAAAKFDKAKDKAKDAYSKAISDAQQWRDAEIERIREEYAARAAKAADAQEEAIEKARPNLNDERNRLVELTPMIEQAGRTAALRSRLAQLQREADELAAQAEAHTKALDRIDALKVQLLADSDIALEVGDDGELYEDGVPFRLLNRARQIDHALRLCRSRAGDLPLVLIDGIQELDSEAYAAFKAYAEAHPEVQYIVTRVSDDENLVVDTGDLFEG